MWECANCAGVCHDDEDECLNCGWPRRDGAPVGAGDTDDEEGE